MSKKYKKRIIELSHQHKLSHLGSCLSSVDAIQAIYEVKDHGDKFVLSNGHAALALYVVMEGCNIIKLTGKFCVHPDRMEMSEVDCSTGSLGQGLPIAVGMSLASKKRIVYCMVSDGECAEGSIWESLRIIATNEINNIRLLLNVNGWAAYQKVNEQSLISQIRGFGFKVIEVNGHSVEEIKETLINEKNFEAPTVILLRTRVDELPFMSGLQAHYHVMSDDDYQVALRWANGK